MTTTRSKEETNVPLSDGGESSGVRGRDDRGHGEGNARIDDNNDDDEGNNPSSFPDFSLRNDEPASPSPTGGGGDGVSAPRRRPAPTSYSADAAEGGDDAEGRSPRSATSRGDRRTTRAAADARRSRSSSRRPMSDAARAAAEELNRRRRQVLTEIVTRAAAAAVESQYPQFRHFTEEAAGQYYDRFQGAAYDARTHAQDFWSTTSRVLVASARFVRRACIVGSILTVLFASGMITYGTMYMAVMPTHAVRAPAYFDYNFVDERHRNGPYGRYLERREEEEVIRVQAAARKEKMRRRGDMESKETSVTAEGSGGGADLDPKENIVCGNGPDAERIDLGGCHRDDSATSEGRDDAYTSPQRQHGDAFSPLSPDDDILYERDDIRNRRSRQATLGEGETQEHRPPTAVIDLLASHTQWTARVDDVLPLPSFHHNLGPRRPPGSFLTSLRSFPRRVLRQFIGSSEGAESSTNTGDIHSSPSLLRPGVRHRIELSLTLPESDVNRRAGVFSVRVDLLSPDGTVLASSDRSAMLPHESSFVGDARRMALLVPMLLGAIPEARTVTVDVADNYVEWADMPLAAVAVRLISPTGSSSSSSSPFVVQVLSAEVRIGKEPNAAQRIMREWFYTCGLAGTMFFMCWYGAAGFVAFVLWRRRYRSRRARRRAEGGSHEPPFSAGAGFDGRVHGTAGMPGGSFREGENLDDLEGIDLGAFTDEEFAEEFDDDEWEEMAPPAQQQHDDDAAGFPGQGPTELNEEEQQGNKQAGDGRNRDEADGSSHDDILPSEPSKAEKAESQEARAEVTTTPKKKKMAVSEHKADFKPSNEKSGQDGKVDTHTQKEKDAM